MVMTQRSLPPGGTGPRDPRLAGFAEGGHYGAALPSATVAGVLEAVSDGAGRPPLGATDDELVGIMGCWQAAEAHAHARLLAVLRELIRRRAKPGFGEYPGGLPGSWETGTAHEVAAELGISWQAAAPLLQLAWELEARLPGTGRLLDQGVLTGFKARIVADEFGVLDDEKVAGAEERLLERDLSVPEMTPARLRKLCQKIADTVDPEGAQRRREETQRQRARVDFYRAHGGDTRLFAEGLPADDALMAKASIQARALAYRQAGIYPDDGMDLLRVLAMLDLVNELSAEARIERYRQHDAAGDEARREEERARNEEATATLAKYRPTARPSGPPDGNGDPPLPDGPSDGGWPGLDSDGEEAGSDTERKTGSAPAEPASPGLPSLVHLTLPLATLLGLDRRPGEVPGYGSVDPGLVKDLARAAAQNPRTSYCFTVTDSDGHATGHACARLIRTPGETIRPDGCSGSVGTAWNLVPDRSRPGPDSGYGTWILTVPGGTRYRLEIHPVPLHSCDHRFATTSYRPGKMLRHLVEIRDGECSFTGCSHPASQSDFEHGKPFDQGGATDSCNGSPVSRRCHRVKQSRGWSLSQPEPGRHVWHTPSGRTYEKQAKAYPD